MYLDDLPSATSLPGSVIEFQENIPLGFIIPFSESYSNYNKSVKSDNPDIIKDPDTAHFD